MRSVTIAYISFALSYVCWLIFYFVEAVKIKHSGSNFSYYMDQLLSIAASGLAFSVLPILSLFTIHYLNYSQKESNLSQSFANRERQA